MTHGPILPPGAGLSGGYSGSTWTMRLTVGERTYTRSGAYLYAVIAECVRLYDARKPDIK